MIRTTVRGTPVGGKRRNVRKNRRCGSEIQQSVIFSQFMLLPLPPESCSALCNVLLRPIAEWKNFRNFFAAFTRLSCSCSPFSTSFALFSPTPLESPPPSLTLFPPPLGKRSRLCYVLIIK